MTGRIVNRSECAEIFGVRDGTVSKWVDAGMPFVTRPATKGKEWSFNTAAVSEWLQERAVKSAVGDASQTDVVEAKRRKAVADAQIAEVEAERAIGAVVPIELAVQVFGSQLDVVKRSIDALPVRAAPLVFGLPTMGQTQSVLEKLVNDIRVELTDYADELSRKDQEQRSQ